MFHMMSSAGAASPSFCITILLHGGMVLENASKKIGRANRHTVTEDRDDRYSLSLSFTLIVSLFFLQSTLISILFLYSMYFPSDYVYPSILHFFIFSVITVIFPLTRSDYTQPPLAITFYFKSTQPPDLPCFRLLFGSTVVIKMLPGS